MSVMAIAKSNIARTTGFIDCDVVEVAESVNGVLLGTCA
jgi:hypothetical protein